MRPLTSRPLPKSSLTLLQSPKLTSQKWRPTKLQSTHKKPHIETSFTLKTPPHLFSLLDINDKVTNQKGTNLPDQYTRRSPEQLQQLLKGAHPKQLAHQDQKPINSRNPPSLHSHMSRQKRLCSSQFKIKRLELQQLNMNNTHAHTDRYFPEDFSYYQEQIKDPSLITKEIADSYSFYRDNLYNVSMKEIKNKNLSSDIFMNGAPKGEDLKNISKINKQNIQNQNKYLQSDIFNSRKVDNYIKEKSSEKYLYVNKEEKYTNVQESKSGWKDKYGFRVVKKNLGSLKYNILVPGITSITPGISDVKCPVNKTRGLTEFIDLTRVSAPNYNPEYQKFYNSNDKTFHKVHGLCSDYLESFGNSKGVVGKPFHKEKEINI